MGTKPNTVKTNVVKKGSWIFQPKIQEQKSNRQISRTNWILRYLLGRKPKALNWNRHLPKRLAKGCQSYSSQRNGRKPSQREIASASNTQKEKIKQAARSLSPPAIANPKSHKRTKGKGSKHLSLRLIEMSHALQLYKSRQEPRELGVSTKNKLDKKKGRYQKRMSSSPKMSRIRENHQESRTTQRRGQSESLKETPSQTVRH